MAQQDDCHKAYGAPGKLLLGYLDWHREVYCDIGLVNVGFFSGAPLEVEVCPEQLSQI